MNLDKLEKYNSLYEDIEHFELISREDFIVICNNSESDYKYNEFENTVCILTDTANIPALTETLMMFDY